MMPPILFFFFNIFLAIWGLFWFYTNFRIVCFSSLKNAGGILIGEALKVQIALGSLDILIMFILLIHERGMLFHRFVSSSISFTSVLVKVQTLYLFSQVYPRYLMVLGAIVNGINSLISLSIFSLLVYKKATDFCTLIFFILPHS